MLGGTGLLLSLARISQEPVHLVTFYEDDILAYVHLICSYASSSILPIADMVPGVLELCPRGNSCHRVSSSRVLNQAGHEILISDFAKYEILARSNKNFACKNFADFDE
jgi:hypothetical protein